MATSSTQNAVKNDWLKELEKPEVQQSLANLLQRLPDIDKSLESIESITQFGQAALQDRDVIDQFEERLTYSSINMESLEALLQLLGKMPKLLELVERLEQMTAFIENVLGDRQSLEALYQSLMDQPVVERGKEAIEMAETIKERAASTPQQQISIFTVMKWLKDPSVQKGLHLIQTTLDVLNSKDK